MDAWISSYTVEVWKGFLCRGSAEGCTELIGCNKNHKRFLRRGSTERFIHCASVEDWIELVGDTKYHKKFLSHESAKGCT